MERRSPLLDPGGYERRKKKEVKNLEIGGARLDRFFSSGRSQREKERRIKIAI